MGKIRSKYKFTKKLAIYWVEDGINKIRIVEGSMKKGERNGDPKVKCENINKRDRWVNHLKKKNRRLQGIRTSPTICLDLLET